MSALGQKQTCAAQKIMSALPPKADMCSAGSRCPTLGRTPASQPQFVGHFHLASLAEMSRL